MSKYFCNHCGKFLDDDQIMQGWENDVDFYENATCGECLSDDLRTYEGWELCHACGELKDSEWHDWETCAENIIENGYEGKRGEIWALKYISNGDINKAIEYMSHKDINICEYVLLEPKEFVEFVGDTVQSDIRNTVKLYERCGDTESPIYKHYKSLLCNIS